MNLHLWNENINTGYQIIKNSFIEATLYVKSTYCLNFTEDFIFILRQNLTYIFKSLDIFSIFYIYFIFYKIRFKYIKLTYNLKLFPAHDMLRGSEKLIGRLLNIAIKDTTGVRKHRIYTKEVKYTINVLIIF